ARLGLKLLAIYIFSLFILYIFNSFGVVRSITYGSENPVSLVDLAVILFTPLAYLGFSLTLWFYSDQISEFIIKEDESVVFDSDFNFDKLQQIAYSFLGIYFIITGVAGMGRKVTDFLVYITTDKFSANISGVIHNILLIVLGLILIYSWEGFLQIIKKPFTGIDEAK
ncbi:MAG: hypothetical protein ACOCZR_04625, partial [Halanaerobiales bacterium]